MLQTNADVHDSTKWAQGSQAPQACPRMTSLTHPDTHIGVPMQEHRNSRALLA